MNTPIEYSLNKATSAQISDHLLGCDSDFVPPLSERVDINEYAQKLVSEACSFEAWSEGRLVGMVAAYCNDEVDHIAYITSVSVSKSWMKKGIAARLMRLCIEHAQSLRMWRIDLEVGGANRPAIDLYKKHGFVEGCSNERFASMSLNLNSGESLD